MQQIYRRLQGYKFTAPGKQSEHFRFSYFMTGASFWHNILMFKKWVHLPVVTSPDHTSSAQVCHHSAVEHQLQEQSFYTYLIKLTRATQHYLLHFLKWGQFFNIRKPTFMGQASTAWGENYSTTSSWLCAGLKLGTHETLKVLCFVFDIICDLERLTQTTTFTYHYIMKR